MIGHFQLTAEENEKTPYKIGLVPGREKATLHEDIQNKEYVAGFHSTVNPSFRMFPAMQVPFNLKSGS